MFGQLSSKQQEQLAETLKALLGNACPGQADDYLQFVNNQ
jgi:hypothetical protein